MQVLSATFLDSWSVVARQTADPTKADRPYSGSGTIPEGSEAFRVRLVFEWYA